MKTKGGKTSVKDLKKREAVYAGVRATFSS